MSTTVSAVDLAEAHEADLAKWTEQKAAIEARLLELVEEEQSVLAQWLVDHPGQRPSGAGNPVATIRKEIDKLTREKDNLLRDLAGKEAIMESLRLEAEAEERERELAEAEAAIATAEASASELWRLFVQRAEELRSLWVKLAAALTELDQLPAGVVPMAPNSAPADLERAFLLALTKPGQKLEAPRVTARRIPTVSTAGTTVASDTTGRAHTLAELGDWR